MSKGRPVGNPHKVNQHMWRKWSREAQKLFNLMMESMRPSMQWAFLHPSAKLMTREQWATTRWNAAVVAADCLTKHTYLGKVKNVKPRSRAKR